MKLKDQIISIFSPVLKLIAKDITDIKSNISISNSIDKPPVYKGQLSIIGESVYIATDNKSTTDWKKLSLKVKYSDSDSWTKAFSGTVKLADYTTNALCTLPVEWEEMRIEIKLRNSTQTQYILIYNDISSSVRKAYSLGVGAGDIIMETNGELKCFAVTEPNLRILSVYYK